jgi:hypothetical protein
VTAARQRLYPWHRKGEKEKWIMSKYFLCLCQRSTKCNYCRGKGRHGSPYDSFDSDTYTCEKCEGRGFVDCDCQVERFGYDKKTDEFVKNKDNYENNIIIVSNRIYSLTTRYIIELDGDLKVIYAFQRWVKRMTS